MLKYLVSIDLGKNELCNFAVQNLAAAPSNPVTGQMYFDTTDKLMHVYDGTAWSVAGEYTFSNGLVEETGRVVKVKAESNKGLSVSSDGVAVVVNADKAVEVTSSGLGVVANASKAVAVSSDGVAVVANADKAIEATASGVGIVVKSNAGVAVSSSGLEAVVNAAKAMEVGASGLGVVADAAGAVTVSSNGVAVKADSAKAVAVSTDGVAVVPNAAKAVEVSASGVGVVANADKGIEVSSSGVGVVVESNKGLKVASTGLAVVPNGDKGIEVSSDGVGVIVNTSKGLAVDSNGLAVSVNTSQGLGFATDGAVTIADASSAGKGVVTLATSVASDATGVVTGALLDAQNYIKLTSLSATSPVKYDNTSGVISADFDSAPTSSSGKFLTSGVIFTELGKKVDANEAITGATKCKITYDAKGLVTEGADLAASDIPDISATYVKQSQLGVATSSSAGTGVATLDANGLVPSSQLPSYVDDVVEAYTDGDPTAANGKLYSDAACEKAITPETGKIYVVVGHKSGTTSYDGYVYRWSGSVYVRISNPLDIASADEAKAGTDDTKVMTPLKVRTATDYWGTDVTATLKNKTMDLTASNGNTISNAALDIFASGVVQTSVRSSSSAADTSVATEAAVRTAIDAIDTGAHKYTESCPALTPASGVVTWTTSSHSLGADVNVTVKDSAGNIVMTDVTCGDSTVTISFNASAAVSAGAYKVVIVG